MANKPLDKGYLLTQFKNFFDKKIKGAFVPSENLASTTTVVAKDLDVTVTDGSVDLVGPRVTANGSDILTENLFPHNLLARYVRMDAYESYGIYQGLDTRIGSTNYLVPYLFGSLNEVPPRGYWETSINDGSFKAPYTGTFYLGLFKNDGDSTYATARRYIDVVLNDWTNNTNTIIMSRNSDYDKLGVNISLTQGHAYQVKFRVYDGFNVPVNNRFYVYPSIYTHTVDNYDYKAFYSVLLSRPYRDSVFLPTYRGINQLTDLYDMITGLSKRIDRVARQSSQQMYITPSDPSTSVIDAEGASVIRESSFLRLLASSEDIIDIVSIRYNEDGNECQLTFLFTSTWTGIRFRLLDYYGGSGSKIVAYDSNGDKTWNSLSDKQIGWQLAISDEDNDYESIGFKLRLYGIGGGEATTGTGDDEPIQVSITRIGSWMS